MREQATRAIADQDLAIEPEVAVEAAQSERYVDGEIPAVRADAGLTPSLTASQRAFDLAEGGSAEEVTELKEKVDALVTDKFGGDYRKAFAHYDTDKNGGINHDELVALLEAAGVGNRFTRGAWSSRIIERLDRGHDEAIQWEEFETVFSMSA